MNTKLIEKLIEMLVKSEQSSDIDSFKTAKHPMLNKRCIIRTYSAGVHVGDISYVNPGSSMELKLTNSIRIWSWINGGLSLSALAKNGIKGGRLNKTGEIYLTNVIEIIPVCDDFDKSCEPYIED